MNKINLDSGQIFLLNSGQKIEKDGNIYLHFPFFIQPTTVDDGEIIYDSEGLVLCNVLTRGEIPDIEAGYKRGGLQANKYIIKKANDEPVDPAAWYFVLRIDKDPHARNAARTYVISVGKNNPQLAIELMTAVESYEKESLFTCSWWSRYYPHDIVFPNNWNDDDQEQWGEAHVNWNEFLEEIKQFKK